MSDEERYAYMLDFDEEDLKENLAKYFKLQEESKKKEEEKL